MAFVGECFYHRLEQETLSHKDFEPSAVMTSNKKSRDLDTAKASIKRHDYHAAADLFQRHADQGDAEAQYWLGTMYIEGPGVGRNFAEALKWLRLSADQGYAPAQTDLGMMYGSGLGRFKTDLGDAARGIRRAAERGLDMEQYLFAREFAHEHGVRPDYIEAYFWFRMAAKTEPKIIPFCDEIVPRLTPEQISTIDRRVAAWEKDHPVPAPK